MINYQNLSHYLSYSKNTYRGCQGVTLLHSSIAFDMSITSLFLPLTSGGKVEILPEQAAADSLELILKKASDFNFIKFTPSHLKALKNHLISQHSRNQKKCLVVGGENLLREDVEIWLG
jgi:non-ribosomal peptide synthetase component F